MVRAKYDAAQTTPDNRRHWANADGLSADAAATPDVRRTLRNRSRYEVANNSYARGIVLTLTNDTIGTGPRLHVLTESPDANRAIEAEFSRWARAIGLPEKLRTMRMARAQDGEAFALLISNDNLRSPIKLDLRLIEAEQVATPSDKLVISGTAVDGIEFDSFGNPSAYHILKNHPGGTAISGLTASPPPVPAGGVIHWFRADRPGQSRGLPEIMPSLPLFAQLRRYTLAVIAAAESAANISIFMKTNLPAGGEAAEVEPMATMDFEANTAVFGPEGWEATQVKAEQPATTYPDAKGEFLDEIARCVNMPSNIVRGNSSKYNYASGRLDQQTYFKSIRVDQAHCEAVVLDRILDAWLAEAVKVFALSVAPFPAHQWFWDGREHVDPAKEANAQATHLKDGTTTYAAEFAKQGNDWEIEFSQAARELGITLEEYQARLRERRFDTAKLLPAPPAPTAPASDKQALQDQQDQQDQQDEGGDDA